MAKKQNISFLQSKLFWGAVIAAVTFIVFFPTLFNNLTNWDDRVYVNENDCIKTLSWENLKWIFGNAYMGNYHPLTMLSLYIDYQIDKMPAITIAMKTFPDSKRKGYTEEFAKQLAGDLLAGQTLFIQVNTIIRTVLSSSMPLTNAELTIKQVLADCNLSTVNGKATASTYSLSEFEQSFRQLPLDKQQRVLAELKKIMADFQ